MARNKKMPRGGVSPAMSAAFTMFALLVYNLATRFTKLVDSAPRIVMLTAAVIFAAAGSLLTLILDKKPKSTRRELLYLLLAIAEIAVLTAFLYGTDGL